MIYINKDIYSEEYVDMIYEICTSIKIGIGCELLYVYFGYPLFNHGNVSTLIPFFIICTKGFVVVCNDDNKEQYKKEFINIMIERKN